MRGPITRSDSTGSLPGQPWPPPVSFQSRTSLPPAHGAQPSSVAVWTAPSAGGPAAAVEHGRLGRAAVGARASARAAPRRRDGGSRGRALGDAAGVERARVVDAVDVEHGHGAAGRERVERHRAGDRRDRRQPLRFFRREPVRHHRAVRVPGGVDAGAIERREPRHVIDHGEREADVVHGGVRGEAAAAAGVPREQAFVEQAVRAVRVGDQPAVAVGERVEAGVALEARAVAAAAVEGEQQRPRRGGAGRRHVQDVAALAAAVRERGARGRPEAAALPASRTARSRAPAA